MLNLALEDVKRCGREFNKACKQFVAGERQKLAALAADPIRLTTLYRCSLEIERAIEGRLRRLKKGYG